MAELEWLISDKFTINSGGKTPQRRKMESAAKCFSSRMCPSTLNFANNDVAARNPSLSGQSPLKSIENYLKQSPLTSRRGCTSASMEVFQPLTMTPKQQCASIMDTEENCFMNDSNGIYDKSTHFFGSSEDMVPHCSTLKMARLENKENLRCILSSTYSRRMLCEDVVKSPTRVDLSCIQSPTRRKTSLLENGPTPSKYTMIQQRLKVPSPVKDRADFTMDYTSRDSGFENSVSYDVTYRKEDNHQLQMVKFHDELTESACQYESDMMRARLEEPLPQCSKQLDNEHQLLDIEDYEYETLRDLDEFDNEDIPLGSSMSKYEIISTDSPDIAIARGTPAAVGRLLADHFQFGSPIGEEETSKNFSSISTHQECGSGIVSINRNNKMIRTETTRMLNFDTPSPRRATPPQGVSSSLQDGSVFKMAIEKLSNRSNKEMVTFDSGLGVEDTDEDTLLVLDELENHDEPQQPASIHSLIHDTVIHKVDEEEGVCGLETSPLCLPFKRPTFRRCFSLNQSSGEMHQDDDSPKSCSVGGFKRPDVSRSITSLLGRKRRKQSLENIEDGKNERLFPQVVSSRPLLQRAMSDNEATIKLALTRSLEDTDLIGDFTGPYRLPVVRSQHSDLKVISPETLSQLLGGEYSNTVRSYQIIDCRYPYEYLGGHVVGAVNLYTEDMIHNALVAGREQRTDPKDPKVRDILIFHCEFSMQRGPKLVRYLRCVDRALHRSSYPALLHPELYLLGGGYCLFSSKHPQHTTPRGCYTTMLDPRHSEDRRRYQGGKYKGKRAM